MVGDAFVIKWHNALFSLGLIRVDLALCTVEFENWRTRRLQMTTREDPPQGTAPEDEQGELQETMNEPTMPRQLPFCWTCRCLYPCCPQGDLFTDPPPGIKGVALTRSPDAEPRVTRVPFKLRMLDTFVVGLFWSAGCNLPKRALDDVRFNRRLWQRYEWLASVHYKGVKEPTPVRGIDGCVFFDVEIQSVFTAGLFLHARVFAPVSDALKRVMLFFHGGGMAVGNSRIKFIHNLTAKLAQTTQRIVISCDYRLAPEFKFPSQVFDAFDVLRWVASGPTELGQRFEIDPSFMAICGDSAGANLALTLATLVRDGLGPDLAPFDTGVRLDHVVLFYPMLFLSQFLLDSGQIERKHTDKPPEESKSPPILKRLHKILPRRHYVQQDRALNMPIIPPPVMDFFYLAYVGAEDYESHSRADRRLCPVLPGVHDLPHVILVSPGLDCLHKEHLYLLKRLIEAGVSVDYHFFEKQPHGFLNFPRGFTSASEECVHMVARDMREHPTAIAQSTPGAQVVGQPSKLDLMRLRSFGSDVDPHE